MTAASSCECGRTDDHSHNPAFDVPDAALLCECGHFTEAHADEAPRLCSGGRRSECPCRGYITPSERREAVNLARDWQTAWVPLDNAKAVADALAVAVLRLNATIEEKP